MRPNIRYGLLILPALFSTAILLQGCTTAQLNTDLDAKLAAEKPLTGGNGLQQESQKLIESEKLSPEKRAELKALSEKTHNEHQALLQESLKLRSVLIKDVLNDKYDDDEVLLIKARMKELEQKKLDLIFRTVAQANKILGHETIHQQDREFMMMNLMDGTPLYRNGF